MFFLEILPRLVFHDMLFSHGGGPAEGLQPAAAGKTGFARCGTGMSGLCGPGGLLGPRQKEKLGLRLVGVIVVACRKKPRADRRKHEISYLLNRKEHIVERCTVWNGESKTIAKKDEPVVLNVVFDEINIKCLGFRPVCELCGPFRVV